MKKLQLPVYRNREKHAKFKYYILFDIGRRLEFTSKRKAEDFSRKLTSYTNDAVRNLFMIQKEMYSIYLDNFFSFDGFEDNRLQKSLDGFLPEINYFYKEFSKGNECMKVEGFYRIINHVENGAYNLKRVFKNKNLYHLYNRINAIYLMVRDIYVNFNQILDTGVVNLNHKKGKLLQLVHKRESKISMM